ncbi:MAG: ABC transporter ATP-binding protein [Bryobacterales bacterium]|nr:ABC transporter ATP-binding protein [Bryobacterales bacterium]
MELTIRGLSKTYAGGRKALDAVTLTIPAGVYGLLGPNGAGKSTLMRILATLLEADEGEAWLGGIDMLRRKHEVRQVLGYLPQDFGAYPRVSVEAMLDHLAALKGIARRGERKDLVEALLRRANLWEVRRKALAALSGGTRRRFGIAQALIGKPQLIIVDEPTAGLDPGERNRFYNLLAETGEDVVVILSTHIVDDVKGLCAHMALLDRGRVLYEGSPEAAVAGLRGAVWQKTAAKGEVAGYAQRYKLISAKLSGGRPLLRIHQPQPPGDGFAPAEPDLEDVFFTRVRGLA